MLQADVSDNAVDESSSLSGPSSLLPSNPGPTHLLEAIEETETEMGRTESELRICRADMSNAALLISSHLMQHAAGGDESTPISNKKKPRLIYQHGNYHRYYGYRIGQAFNEDPRLSLLEKTWFSNKRCLDIGCNEGVVTLSLVSKFFPRSMVGVDIDEHLIKKSCTALRQERAKAITHKINSRKKGTPPAVRRAAHALVTALSQTWFVHGDVLHCALDPESLDTVSCLSMTKWVHLNKGDQGLKEMFQSVWTSLTPGGIFVLEPQPWKSYKAAQHKAKQSQDGTSFVPLDQLALRPDDFAHYLCDVVGFRMVKRKTPESSMTGFDRMILVFRKPA